jgi:hypothetical protein
MKKEVLEMVFCRYCGRELHPKGIRSHEAYCEKNPASLKRHFAQASRPNDIPTNVGETPIVDGGDIPSLGSIRAEIETIVEEKLGSTGLSSEGEQIPEEGLTEDEEYPKTGIEKYFNNGEEKPEKIPEERPELSPEVEPAKKPQDKNGGQGVGEEDTEPNVNVGEERSLMEEELKRKLEAVIEEFSDIGNEVRQEIVELKETINDVRTTVKEKLECVDQELVEMGAKITELTERIEKTEQRTEDRRRKRDEQLGQHLDQLKAHTNRSLTAMNARLAQHNHIIRAYSQDLRELKSQIPEPEPEEEPPKPEEPPKEEVEKPEQLEESEEEVSIDEELFFGQCESKEHLFTAEERDLEECPEDGGLITWFDCPKRMTVVLARCAKKRHFYNTLDFEELPSRRFCVEDGSSLRKLRKPLLTLVDAE